MGQLGIGYAEFWTMPPRHFWWLVEAHRQMQDHTGRRRAVHMTEEQKDELRALMAREQARLDEKARGKA